jgi:glutathione peroxidase
MEGESMQSVFEQAPDEHTNRNEPAKLSCLNVWILMPGEGKKKQRQQWENPEGAESHYLLFHTHDLILSASPLRNCFIITTIANYRRSSMIRRALTVTTALIIAITGAAAAGIQQESANVPSVLNFTMNSLTGKPVNLSKYQGKVLLMVNVASFCGYTPQYAGLEELNKKYASQGLNVLGFPANEFGSQEPGSDAEIAEFCDKTYGVKFDMFSKIVVKGLGQHPLYKYLTSAATDPKFAGDVKWNFEKFLIGRDGKIVARFLSDKEPLSREVVSAIEAELAKK